MKKLFVALVVGSMLFGGSVLGATFNPQCKPSGGGSGVACADTTVVTSAGLTVWNIPVVYATDVQSAHVGSSNGDFTQLQVGNVTTLNIANVNQLNAGGLSVTGNATINGGLTVNQWVTGGAAQFSSLSLFSGGSLSFWDNVYAGISATTNGLWIRGSQLLFTRHNGTGACWVTKSLDGTKTRWHWTDNNGDDQSTTSLGSVPTQCLNNN